MGLLSVEYFLLGDNAELTSKDLTLDSGRQISIRPQLC